jgi:crotonobetainyl-CoA:carnitine CoA-transferase CaiB-like acyl-CoA transferase
MALCEQAEIPFAPIARPEDLFDDPQLNQGGGLELTEFPGGQVGKLPRLPLEWNGERLPSQRQPPRPGQHSREILQEWLDLSQDAINELIDKQRVKACD